MERPDWTKLHLEFPIPEDCNDLTEVLESAFDRAYERTGKRPLVFAVHPATMKRFDVAEYRGVLVLQDKRVYPDRVYIPVTV